MGGSTPKSSGLGSGPRRQKQVNCLDDQKAQLSSPQPSVLAKLEIDDEMDIVLVGDSCNVVFKGQFAGSIIGIELPRLIQCINEGNSFIAIVRSIDGARCSITIRNTDL